MSKNVLTAYNFNNLQELRASLDSLVSEFYSTRFKPHLSEIYVNGANRLTLVEETLTDGSKVLNVHFFNSERLT